ncbi:hypothetical protein [Photobacterium atrarenae]|uniref:Uncharacterized protein n=1 Tax=Photobacterium atrarenae TaxID=865757 RepID=A0ABY5GLF8_9GAMM|nr:hypothetical protein [Photobacterium atrarenae]UTV30155.1 hypothetical protein NNL38_16345 [Photobacterium atrarenae]
MAVEAPFKLLLNADLTDPRWQALIDSYLESSFKDGGRGPAFFDCWGMGRDIQLKTGVPAQFVPSFGAVGAQDKRQMTTLYQDVSRSFDVVPPRPLAIACGFVGQLLWHIGTVVPNGSQLEILHTSASFGPHLSPIHIFERQFLRVEYRYAANRILHE